MMNEKQNDEYQQQQIAFPKTSSGQAVLRNNELHHTTTQVIYKPQHKPTLKFQCLTQSNVTAQSNNPTGIGCYRSHLEFSLPARKKICSDGVTFYQVKESDR